LNAKTAGRTLFCTLGKRLATSVKQKLEPGSEWPVCFLVAGQPSDNKHISRTHPNTGLFAFAAGCVDPGKKFSTGLTLGIGSLHVIL
jgi:hypothetical protein